MAKIVTETTTNIMKQPFKTTDERIKQNTNPDGGVLCIYCEVGYMTLQEKELEASNYDEIIRTTVKLTTYCCNLCEDTVICDKEAKIIRKTLA